jgi:preprotein translocase subunit SecF
VADLKEREPEVQALRRRVQARRSSAARQGGTRAPAPSGPVATARRARPARGGVAVAELPNSVEADVVVESPSSVRPDTGSGATAAPRPGARPQRPGAKGRPPGKKRR